MARIRVSMVGLGMAVGPHVKSLLDLAGRVEIAHAVSRTAARREAFTRAFGVPAHGDVETALADPSVDAVLLLTPPATHLDLVRKAAGAGKHILLEKPLEVSLARSEAVVEAAEAAGVTLGLVLQRRFRPAARALKEIVAAGGLGEIVSASARLSNWRPQSYYDEPGRGTLARDGGGVLLTQGIHLLDAFQWIAGLPAEVSAYAATSAVHRMETEDIAAAALRFDNGALGTLFATTTAVPGFPDEIEVIGTRATARVLGEVLTIRDGGGGTTTVGEETGSSGASADPMAFPHDQHLALITDFLDAIAAGREPAVPGREALKGHDLIDAILASARSGRPEPVRRR